MVQNVRYSNGPPSHVTLPFEYRTPILSVIQMNPGFRWLLYHLFDLTICIKFIIYLQDSSHYTIPKAHQKKVEYHKFGE